MRLKVHTDKLRQQTKNNFAFKCKEGLFKIKNEIAARKSVVSPAVVLPPP